MKRILKLFIYTLLTITIIILYSRFIGTYGFITKEKTIYNKNLPTNFDGLKIVHFSDIHYKRAINEQKIKNIVEEINLINPGIVVFTGDLIDKDVINTNENYNFLEKMLTQIKSKYGKYAILGNHDYHEKEKIIDIYNNSNFKYLENSYDIIYNQYNEKIFIGGLGNVTNNLDDIEKTFEYFNNNEEIDYKIILTHEPDISDEIINYKNVELILAGHSHNGQIKLPILGALYTPNNSKKYYDEYYKLNDTDLFISSGIGVSQINYRLFNKPSINFYRINKTS